MEYLFHKLSDWLRPRPQDDGGPPLRKPLNRLELDPLSTHSELWYWRNPHCFLYVDVVTDDGEQVTWMLELLNTILATNAGWTAEKFKVGDELMLAGNPARTGAKRLRTTKIYRPADGFSYDITNRRLGGPEQTVGTRGL